MTDQNLKLKKASSVRNYATIKQILATGSFSVHEIAHRVHLEPKTVRRYVQAMRLAKDAHVSGHRKEVRSHGRSFPVPLYTAGDQKDAKFRAKTKYQLHREYLARRKRDPVRYMIYLNKMRLQRIKAVPQPELAFFFGRRVSTPQNTTGDIQ